jgi:hypothetical protein
VRRTKYEETLITLIGAVCIVATSATMAVATATPLTATSRSLVANASSASSGLPTKCPPAGLVGRALALTVSKPTVVTDVPGMALECQYTSGKSKTTLSYMSETRKAFLAEENALPKTSILIVTLGKGIAAYRVPPYLLSVQNGTVECVIESKVSAVHEDALAEVLLKSYW